MTKTWKSLLQVELPLAAQRDQLVRRAEGRRWGLALLLVGWLHLAAFSFCHYLSVALHYHDSPGYLAVWVGELCGMWLVFRLCGGRRPADAAAPALEVLVRRIWIAYFVLTFNLGSLNTLRGHRLFEFFPAMATLASFAFLMMTLVVSWRFIAAVLVMFTAGLLMAAHLLHSYLIFALAWWLVLHGIGLTLWLGNRRGQAIAADGACRGRPSAACVPGQGRRGRF